MLNILKHPSNFPVTFLSGLLGVGKTTLLNRVLNNREKLKVAETTNDIDLLKNTFLPEPPKTPRQVINYKWSEREKILDDDVNLFCWKRHPNPEISKYLKQLVKDDVPSIRFSTNQFELKDYLKEAQNVWSQNTIEPCNPFWEDVYRLVYDFLALSSQEKGRIHIKIVQDDACQKFHTDGFALRMFTTYYGRGTEWLPESACNREALGKSNNLIVKKPSQIQKMNPFEVGILKVEEQSGKRSLTKGIVHRSPEISQIGEKRVILRVDI